ncbi:S8 family peptidase [Halogeometricum borinquense]|nr:S8 family serine peptidase [Halogeometricum borinquense]
MQSLSRRTLLKGVVGSTVALGAMGTASAEDGRNQYIVTASGKGVRKRLEREGFEVVKSIADDSVHLVIGGSKSAIQRVSGVKSADSNEVYRLLGPAKQATSSEGSRDDEYAETQWDKHDDTTGAFQAHDTATGSGRRVAIIDTGIETDHPDLTTATADGKLFRADGLSSPTGTPTVTGDTTIQARLPPESEEIESYTYLGAPKLRTQAAADDVDSHGTHCAGISTGNNTGTTGIAGMAPDAEAVPLRVFYWKKVENFPWDKDGDGEAEEHVTVTTLATTDFDILSAIEYAPETNADAANMSLGGGVIKGSAHKSGEHVAYQTVIQNAVKRGTVVTASAGNASSNLQQGGYYTLPNSVPGAMSITATGPGNERAFYSNDGTSDVDVGAPGGGYETAEKTLAPDTEWPYPLNLVYSSVPADLNDGSQYAWYAGTSMAAPQVAGLVALVREVAPDLTAKQVQNVIERTARFSKGKSSPDIGAGVVYAPDAVAEADRFSK